MDSLGVSASGLSRCVSPNAGLARIADGSFALPSVRDGASEVESAGHDIKVVITDIDGTLVGAAGNLFADGDGRPSGDAALAIVSLAAAGISLVLLSGRRPEHVATVASAIGASGYIAEMGTVVVVDAGYGSHEHNEVIRPLGEYPFPDEQPHDAMLRTGAIQSILDRNPGKVEFHTPWHEERETSHLLRGELNVEEENRALAEGGHGWCEIVDNGVIPVAYPNLNADPVRAYHVVPRGSGKAQGVRTWLSAAGYEARQAVALGDARGDLVVAPEVAIFFLMANGLDLDPSIALDASRYPNVFLTDSGYGPGWAAAVATLTGQPGVAGK